MGVGWGGRLRFLAAVPVPRTAAELHRSRRSLAELGRRRLLWGRRLAVGALALFGAAVTVAWLDPVEPADVAGCDADEQP